MEIVTNTALISINETLIVQVLSFLVFLFVMNRLMFRPLRKTMGQRLERVAEVDGDINKAEADIEQSRKEMAKKASDARRQAFEAAKKLENTGKQEAEKIIDAALEEIAVLREKTRKVIDAQVSEARRHIGKESEDLAVHIMEKVLERRLPHDVVR